MATVNASDDPMDSRLLQILSLAIALFMVWFVKDDIFRSHKKTWREPKPSTIMNHARQALLDAESLSRMGKHYLLYVDMRYWRIVLGCYEVLEDDVLEQKLNSQKNADFFDSVKSCPSLFLLPGREAESHFVATPLLRHWPNQVLAPNAVIMAASPRFREDWKSQMSAAASHNLRQLCQDKWPTRDWVLVALADGTLTFKAPGDYVSHDWLFMSSYKNTTGFFITRDRPFRIPMNLP